MALTAFKIITGSTALWSLMLVAAIQRHAAAPPVVRAEEPQRSMPKADRLPLFIPVVDQDRHTRPGADEGGRTGPRALAA